MKHLLSIEDLTVKQIREILALAKKLKATRGKRSHPRPLKRQIWAMIFAKYSTRTRVSFEVGIRELGGRVMFLSNNDIQLGRGEPIVDTARVMGRMVHGCVIRTFHQKDVVDFAATSGIPTIFRSHRRRASVPDSCGYFHHRGETRPDQKENRLLHWRRRV